MINSNDTSDVVDVFYNIIHVGITVNIRMALWIVAINKVVVKILHYDSAIHWLYVEQEYQRLILLLDIELEVRSIKYFTSCARISSGTFFGNEHKLLDAE